MWQRSDEVFRDREDWRQQAAAPESLRVYPRQLSRSTWVLPDSLVGQGGSVTVGFMIETDGAVRDARVLFSTNPRLNEVCRRTILTFRFTPGTVAGRPSIWRYQDTCTFPH